MSVLRVHGAMRIGWNPWARPDWIPDATTWERDVVAVLRKALPRAPVTRLRKVVQRGLKTVPVHLWPWMDRREAACRLMEDLFPRLKRAGFLP